MNFLQRNLRLVDSGRVDSRRQFTAAMAAALVLPRSATAQAPAKIFRIGLIHVGSDHVPPSHTPFLEGMRALGYDEGKNIQYDFQNAVDEKAALEAARKFAAQKVDLVVAYDQEACTAAHIGAPALPVVMVNASNPIAAGFGRTLAHPGGHMTGFAGRAELPAKELEFLSEMAPKSATVLVLFDAGDAASVGWRDDVRRAAVILKVKLLERNVSDAASLNKTFAALKPGQAQAVIFASPVVRHRHQKLVLELSARLKMAMVGSRRDTVQAGALLSYSYDFVPVGRLTASRYVDRLLKGMKPADLPIEEVTDYKLVVNSKVAKRFGFRLPNTILARADDVIE